jgi:hypothetical protein
MAITRIKSNQITDAAVTSAKIADANVTAAKLANNLTYGSNLTVSKLNSKWYNHVCQYNKYKS